MQSTKNILAIVLSASLILSPSIIVLADTLAPPSWVSGKGKTIVEAWSELGRIPESKGAERRKLMASLRATLATIRGIPDLAIAYHDQANRMILFSILEDGGVNILDVLQFKEAIRPEREEKELVLDRITREREEPPPSFLIRALDTLTLYTANGIVWGLKPRTVATLQLKGHKIISGTKEITEETKEDISDRFDIPTGKVEDWLGKRIAGVLGLELNALRRKYLWLDIFAANQSVRIEMGGLGRLLYRDLDGTLVLSVDLLHRELKKVQLDALQDAYEPLLRETTRTNLLREGLRESGVFKDLVEDALPGRSPEELEVAVEIYARYEDAKAWRSFVEARPAVARLLSQSTTPFFGEMQKIEDILGIAEEELLEVIRRETMERTGVVVSGDLLREGLRRLEDKSTVRQTARVMLDEFDVVIHDLSHHLNNVMNLPLTFSEMWLEGSTSHETFREVMIGVRDLQRRLYRLSHIKDPYYRTAENESAHGVTSKNVLREPQDSDARETTLRVHVTREFFGAYSAIQGEYGAILRNMESLQGRSERPNLRPEDAFQINTEKDELMKNILRVTRDLELLVKQHEGYREGDKEHPGYQTILERGIDVGRVPAENGKYRVVVRSRGGEVEIQSPLLGGPEAPTIPMSLQPPATEITESSPVRWWQFWKGRLWTSLGILVVSKMTAATSLWAQERGISTSITDLNLYENIAILFIGAAGALFGTKAVQRFRQWNKKRRRDRERMLEDKYRQENPWQYPIPEGPEDLRLRQFRINDLPLVERHSHRVSRDSALLARRIRLPHGMDPFSDEEIALLRLAGSSHDLWKVEKTVSAIVKRKRTLEPEELEELEKYKGLSSNLLEGAKDLKGEPLDFATEELVLLDAHRAPWQILRDGRIASPERRERLFYLGVLLFALNELDGRSDKAKVYKTTEEPEDPWNYIQRKVLGGLPIETSRHLGVQETEDIILNLKAFLEDATPMLRILLAEREENVDEELGKKEKPEERVAHLIKMRSSPGRFLPYTEQELEDRLGRDFRQKYKIPEMVKEMAVADTGSEDGPKYVEMEGSKFILRDDIEELVRRGLIFPLAREAEPQVWRTVWVDSRDRQEVLAGGNYDQVYQKHPKGGPPIRALVPRGFAQRRAHKDSYTGILKSSGPRLYVKNNARRDLLEKSSDKFVGVKTIATPDSRPIFHIMTTERFKELKDAGDIMTVRGPSRTDESGRQTPTEKYFYVREKDKLLKTGNLVRAFMQPDPRGEVFVTEAYVEQAIQKGEGSYARMNGASPSLEGDVVYVSESGLGHASLLDGKRAYLIRGMQDLYEDAASKELIGRAYQVAKEIYGDAPSSMGGKRMDAAIHMARVVAVPTDIRVPAELVAAALLLRVSPAQLNAQQGQGIPSEVWDWLEDFVELEKLPYNPPQRLRKEEPYIANVQNILLGSPHSQTYHPLFLLMAYQFHRLRWSREGTGEDFSEQYSFLLDVFVLLAEKYGLNKFAETMRQLGYERAFPEEHVQTVKQLEASLGMTYEDLGFYAELLQEQVILDAQNEGLDAHIEFNRKSTASIAEKMRQRRISPSKIVEELKDLVRGRVVVAGGDFEEAQHLPVFQALTRHGTISDPAGLFSQIDGRPEEISVRGALNNHLLRMRPFLTQEELDGEEERVIAIIKKVKENLSYMQMHLQTEEMYEEEMSGEALHAIYAHNKRGRGRLYRSLLRFAPTTDIPARHQQLRDQPDVKDNHYVRVTFADPRRGAPLSYVHRVPNHDVDTQDNRPTVADLLTRRGFSPLAAFMDRPGKLLLNGRPVESLGDRVTNWDRLEWVSPGVDASNHEALVQELADLQRARNNRTQFASLLPMSNPQSRFMWERWRSESPAPVKQIEGARLLRQLLFQEGIIIGDEEELRKLIAFYSIDLGASWSSQIPEFQQAIAERLIEWHSIDMGFRGSEHLSELQQAMAEGLVNTDRLLRAARIELGKARLQIGYVALRDENMGVLGEAADDILKTLEFIDPAHTLSRDQLLDALFEQVGIGAVNVSDVLPYYKETGKELLEAQEIDVQDPVVFQALLPFLAYKGYDPQTVTHVIVQAVVGSRHLPVQRIEAYLDLVHNGKVELLTLLGGRSQMFQDLRILQALEPVAEEAAKRAEISYPVGPMIIPMIAFDIATDAITVEDIRPRIQALITPQPSQPHPVMGTMSGNRQKIAGLTIQRGIALGSQDETSVQIARLDEELRNELGIDFDAEIPYEIYTGEGPLGHANINDRVIEISQQLLENPDALKRVMAHELRHWIMATEGLFAPFDVEGLEGMSGPMSEVFAILGEMWDIWRTDSWDVAIGEYETLERVQQEQQPFKELLIEVRDALKKDPSRPILTGNLIRRIVAFLRDHRDDFYREYSEEGLAHLQSAGIDWLMISEFMGATFARMIGVQRNQWEGHELALFSAFVDSSLRAFFPHEAIAALEAAQPAKDVPATTPEAMAL